MRKIVCICCALLLLCSCQKAEPSYDKDLLDFDQAVSGQVESADDSFGFSGSGLGELYTVSKGYLFEEGSVCRGCFYLTLPEGTDESHQDPANAIAEAVYTLDYDQEPGSEVKQLRYLTLSIGGEDCSFQDLRLRLPGGEMTELSLTVSEAGLAELPLDLTTDDYGNCDLRLKGTVTFQGTAHDFEAKLWL